MAKIFPLALLNSIVLYILLQPRYIAYVSVVLYPANRRAKAEEERIENWKKMKAGKGADTHGCDQQAAILFLWCLGESNGKCVSQQQDWMMILFN